MTLFLAQTKSHSSTMRFSWSIAAQKRFANATRVTVHAQTAQTDLNGGNRNPRASYGTNPSVDEWVSEPGGEQGVG